MKTKWLVIMLLGVCSAMLGCETVSNRKYTDVESGTLEPQTLLKFSDIPVPVGFKLLADESYSFESYGVRVGLLKYQGKAEMDKVVNFYKEQMEMYNWNLLNAVEYGQRMLNFDRETETCIVNLNPQGRYIISTISIGPKSEREKVVVEKRTKPVK